MVVRDFWDATGVGVTLCVLCASARTILLHGVA
jgi:hypothetical protein